MGHAPGKGVLRTVGQNMVISGPQCPESDKFFFKAHEGILVSLKHLWLWQLV